MGRAERWIISGGIGTGKSAVRRLLEEHGFHTVDADSVGHEVLSRGGAAYGEVVARWPQAVDEDDDIDRAELARIVFSDPAALDELESLTHPHIFGTIRDRVQGIPDSVAVEIPLLKHGLGEAWQRLIVDSDDRVRLDRLIGKGMSEEDARGRTAAQPTRGEWLAAADIVVSNHSDLSSLAETVERLLDDR